MQSIHFVDVQVSEYLNTLAYHNMILDFIVKFFGDSLAYIIITAAVLFVFVNRERMKDRVVALSALIIPIIIRIFVKPIIVLFYPVARPFIENPNIHVLLAHGRSEDYQSMPSTHTMFFFAFSTIIYMHSKYWGSIFYILAIIVGLSRVAGGMHYLSDILVGAIMGIISAFILNKLFVRNILGVKTLLERGVRLVK